VKALTTVLKALNGDHRELGAFSLCIEHSSTTNGLSYDSPSSYIALRLLDFLDNKNFYAPNIAEVEALNCKETYRRKARAGCSGKNDHPLEDPFSPYCKYVLFHCCRTFQVCSSCIITDPSMETIRPETPNPSTAFDYILPYARAVVEFNIPQRTVPIDAILQDIITGLHLNGCLHKLPTLWTWLVSAGVSPLKKPPRNGPVHTLIFNDTLQRLCESRGFSVARSVNGPQEQSGDKSPSANRQVSQTKLESSEYGSPLRSPLSSLERPLYGRKVPGQHRWRAGPSPRYYEPSKPKSRIPKATYTGNSSDFKFYEDQTATTHLEAAHPRPKRTNIFLANAATRETPSIHKAWKDSERSTWSIYEKPGFGTSKSEVPGENANSKVGNSLDQPSEANAVHQKRPSHSGFSEASQKEYGVKAFRPRFTKHGMVIPKIEHGCGILVSSEAASYETRRAQVLAQGALAHLQDQFLASGHEEGSNTSSSCPSSPTCQASIHSWEPYIGTALGPNSPRQDKEYLAHSRHKPLTSQLAQSEGSTRLTIPFLLNPASPNQSSPITLSTSINTSSNRDSKPEGNLIVDTGASNHPLSDHDFAPEDDLSAMTDKKKPRKVAAGTIPPTLPPTVEEAYRKKCVELKRRMAEVEQSNDSFRLRKTRLLRGIRKMRLERTILLDLLGKRMRKNGANGYYDTDSEGSSDGPPTVRHTQPNIDDDGTTNSSNAIQPHDKPLRSKRSHRRAMQSPPPPLANQLSGPNPALSQQPLPAFQPPYAPHHEGPYAHTPNGVSHIQPHPAQRASFSLNNLHPTPQSQIPFPASAYDFFVEENFLRLPQNQLKSRDELLADAIAAWQGQSHAQAQEWLAYYNERLQKWRADMDYRARQTGERPQGVLRGGGLEDEMAEQEAAARDEEMERLREDEIERLRDEEMAERVGGGRRVGSGGFTSING